MRLILTGGSSFTGFWFARALVEAGHELIVTLSGHTTHYEGTRAGRVGKMREYCEVVFDAPFGSDNFLTAIARSGGLDVLCHHWSYVQAYSSPKFDPISASAMNVLRVVDVLRAFRRVGGRAMVLTGTVTELNEGAGTLPLRAFWPYSLSKTVTAILCAAYCESENVSFRKFVIPNPFGPFEEPRFTDYLLRNWFANSSARVKTPLYVRDNIHVNLLSKAYAAFATGAQAQRDRFAPSGYVENERCICRAGRPRNARSVTS